MIRLLFLLFTGSVFTLSTENNTIYGKWTGKLRDGTGFRVIFRQDGTHDYIINNKPFSSGRFTYNHDTLRESDPICNADYFASYKIAYLPNDSIQFTLIEDTCAPRAYDMAGMRMKRETN